MEELFATNSAVNNQNINYRVIFADEKYTFMSEADQRTYKTFSLRREHDAWVDQDQLPPDIKKQAEDALEQYLMKQH